MKKSKVLEAIVVITTGFVVLYLVYNKSWLLYIAMGAGLSGIFVKPLAALIARLWYKLGDVLGFVVSKVVLGILYYLLLVPIALLHNLFNKDVLSLKSKNSGWTTRGYTFSKKDLTNPF